MDTVVDLMLKYFAAIDSGDDAAIEAAYQAWMTARGEKPAKRLVAIGDAGGVTAVAPEWEDDFGDDGEPFVSCEWQYNDDWHAARQELADYDDSMDAASIYGQ